MIFKSNTENSVVKFVDWSSARFIRSFSVLIFRNLTAECTWVAAEERQVCTSAEVEEQQVCTLAEAEEEPVCTLAEAEEEPVLCSK
jgi:hypothetical protein